MKLPKTLKYTIEPRNGLDHCVTSTSIRKNFKKYIWNDCGLKLQFLCISCTILQIWGIYFTRTVTHRSRSSENVFLVPLALRVNKNPISDGFGAVSRHNHKISGENPLFWPILAAENISYPPSPEKNQPLCGKNIFSRKIIRKWFSLQPVQIWAPNSFWVPRYPIFTICFFFAKKISNSDNTVIYIGTGVLMSV